MYLLTSPILKQDHPLANGITKLGRRRDCDIVLPSDKVSKIHLEFLVERNTAKVRDPGSHNGTMLNDQRMVKHKWYDLREGDVIVICEFAFRIRTDLLDPIDDSDVLVDSEFLPKIDQSQSLSISELSKSESDENQQLLALVKLTKGLRYVLKTDELMRQSTGLLLEVFRGANRSAIAVLEDEQIKLKWWSERPSDLAPVAQPSEADEDQPFQISRTLLSHVITNCDAILTSDAQVDFIKTDSVYMLPLRSVMAAPLIDTEGLAIGAVYMDSSETNQFNRRDFEVFAGASTQLSLALNFAKLHEKSVHDALILRDVENASAIQLQYLPHAPPAIAGYDVASFYRAARHIGGDYYDFIPLSNGCWAILLGDVVGKGVPAALTMVRLATEARSAFELTNNAAEVLTRLNRRFPETFVTLLVTIVDPRSGAIHMSNAGHELPILRHAEGGVQLVGDEYTNFPIGVIDDTIYTQGTIELKVGESFTLYSDGFPDAECAAQTRFGRQLLMDALTQHAGNCEEAIELVVDSVDQFIGKHPQFDDMCLVQIRRTE